MDEAGAQAEAWLRKTSAKIPAYVRPLAPLAALSCHINDHQSQRKKRMLSTDMPPPPPSDGKFHRLRALPVALMHAREGTETAGGTLRWRSHARGES